MNLNLIQIETIQSNAMPQWYRNEPENESIQNIGIQNICLLQTDELILYVAGYSWIESPLARHPKHFLLHNTLHSDIHRDTQIQCSREKEKERTDRTKFVSMHHFRTKSYNLFQFKHLFAIYQSICFSF